MRKYHKSDLSKFEIENGEIICPAGDYTAISYFPSKCHFLDGCVFHSQSYFSNGCKFESNCDFGSLCYFGDICVFKSNNTFSYNSEFGQSCSFGHDCTFSNKTRFAKNCTFDIRNSFGNGCQFGLSCKLSSESEFGNYCIFNKCCQFEDMCNFGHHCDFLEGCIIDLYSNFGSNCHFESNLTKLSGREVGRLERIIITDSLTFNSDFELPFTIIYVFEDKNLMIRQSGFIGNEREYEEYISTFSSNPEERIQSHTLISKMKSFFNIIKEYN